MASSDGGVTRMMSCRGCQAPPRSLGSCVRRSRHIAKSWRAASRVLGLLHVRGSRLEWIRSPRARGLFLSGFRFLTTRCGEAETERRPRAALVAFPGVYGVAVSRRRRSPCARRHWERIQGRFSFCSQIVCSCSCMIGREMGPGLKRKVVLSLPGGARCSFLVFHRPSPACVLGHRHRTR